MDICEIENRKAEAFLTIFKVKIYENPSEIAKPPLSLSGDGQTMRAY